MKLPFIAECPLIAHPQRAKVAPASRMEAFRRPSTACWSVPSLMKRLYSPKNPRLEQHRLIVFRGVSEVAKSYSDQTESSIASETHSIEQRQGNSCEFLGR